MAIYRSVQMTFWTDAKVVDNFTPEDRYFYLYLLTNPHTNLCGCYEISFKQISDETGYTKEVVERLLDRMENIHNVIRYSRITKELLMINWSKFNWTKSDKFRKPLLSEIESVKELEFKNFLIGLYKDDDTVSIPYRYPIDTTVTDTVNNIPTKLKNTNTVSLTYSGEKPKKEPFKDEIEEILNFLNQKTGKKYTSRSKASVKMIRERLREGFTVDEFKAVIENKANAWLNTDYKVYLRPETLFCAKHFDSYLNDVEDEKQRRKREEREIDEQQNANYGNHWTDNFFAPK